MNGFSGRLFRMRSTPCRRATGTLTTGFQKEHQDLLRTAREIAEIADDLVAQMERKSHGKEAEAVGGSRAMFKIGEVPSLQAGPIEHADFLELECLRQSDRNASGSDLAAALGRVDDDLPEDRARSDTRMENMVDEAFSELGYRAQQSGWRAACLPLQRE